MCSGNTLMYMGSVKARAITSATEYRNAVGEVLESIGDRLFGDGNYAIKYEFTSVHDDRPANIVLLSLTRKQFMGVIPFTSKEEVLHVSSSWRSKWLRSLVREYRAAVIEEFTAVGLL